jgi:hypothetical protein
MSLIPLYLCVRAMCLVDAFAPEMSAPVATFIPRPAAAAGAVRRATGLIEGRFCRTGAKSAR